MSMQPSALSDSEIVSSASNSSPSARCARTSMGRSMMRLSPVSR